MADRADVPGRADSANVPGRAGRADRADRAPIAQRPRVLELGSGPYAHIRAFAGRWPGVEWCGSVRDAGEAAEATATLAADPPRRNLRPPRVLDIAAAADWDALRRDAARAGPFVGVVMLNLIHCCPAGLPESIFRALSPAHAEGRALLAPAGWVAAYGAFLDDGGGYRSAGDEAFDTTHVRAAHPSLGLRSVRSITELAGRWGFVEESRGDMPGGNLWVVWRAT